MFIGVSYNYIRPNCFKSFQDCQNRFLVICHAVPLTIENRGTDYAHLVFTSLDLNQSTENHKVYLLERGTQPLTEILLIPNAENAAVDIRKLHDYCLNPDHDQGKHKARLFSTILGITADNAEELRKILLEVVKTHEARLGRRDEYGQRYTLDFVLEWQDRNTTVRSGWIIEHGFDIPRLTTCYPL